MNTTIECDFIKTYSWLNAQLFKRILCREYENDAISITSFSVNAALGKGENYASQMLRAKVLYNTGGLEDHADQEISFVIKAAIIPWTEANAWVGELGMFRKEIFAFQRLIPEAEKLLRSIGDGTRLAAKFV